VAPGGAKINKVQKCKEPLPKQGFFAGGKLQGGGAPHGALSGVAARCDPKRLKIIEALPDLPEPIIDAILNLLALGKPKG
jgi:hypothetical protein